MPVPRLATGWITFLSDYGLDDVSVGVCKGVVARIAPQARVVDVCHQIPRQDVEEGATALADAMRYLPDGVHLALVDPVGSAPARAVAVASTAGAVLVGPDNGVLSLAVEQLGGAEAAYELRDERYWLEPGGSAFRGRDVFAPVAAHLAGGLPLPQVGPRLDLAGLVRLRLREAVVDDDHVHAEVRQVDHFGNLALNVRRSDLEAAGITLGDTVELRCSGRAIAVPLRVTFGEVPQGRLAVCEDSLRRVMVAVNAGSAAAALRVGRGDPVVIARVPAGTGASARPGGTIPTFR